MNILIVEDNPNNLELLENYLSDSGYEVFIATNGKIALQRLNYVNPDLILLDVLMPEINGFEVCEKIKSSKKTKDIPIIFMTALTSKEDKVKGFKLGAVDYIGKPIQKEELLARVKTHLKIYKYQEHLEKEVKNRTEELTKKNLELILLKEDLENINNTLDLKIKKETTLRKKQEQLLIQQSRLAEMGEMISMIAHQWRQPLSALGTITQNTHLRFSLGELNQEYLDKQMLLSDALTGKMSKTIDDFRNFFKPNKEKHAFSIQAAIQQTIFLIDDSFKSNSIEVVNQISEDVTIYGFESELSHVLLNIITNSKDALLELKIGNPSITIKTEIGDKYIEILISDNAGGIEEKIINRIFEPYFTTKDSYNGTGLGLYMSKMIIEQNMGGKLSAHNVEHGVEFSICIPISENTNE